MPLSDGELVRAHELIARLSWELEGAQLAALTGSGVDGAADLQRQRGEQRRGHDEGGRVGPEGQGRRDDEEPGPERRPGQLVGQDLGAHQAGVRGRQAGRQHSGVMAGSGRQHGRVDPLSGQRGDHPVTKITIKFYQRRQRLPPAVHAHSVDGVTVRVDPLAVRADRLLVLRLENRRVRTARPARLSAGIGARTVRESDGIAVAHARAVAENPGRHPHNFVRIAIEERQPLNLPRSKGAGDGRAGGLQLRLTLRAHCDSLRHCADFELDVQAGHPLGLHSHIPGLAPLEAGRFHRQRVLARPEFGEAVETRAAAGRRLRHSGRLIRQSDLGVGYRRALGILHHALHARAELRPPRPGQQQNQAHEKYPHGRLKFSIHHPPLALNIRMPPGKKNQFGPKVH